jgi:hypothetical protein
MHHVLSADVSAFQLSGLPRFVCWARHTLVGIDKLAERCCKGVHQQSICSLPHICQPSEPCASARTSTVNHDGILTPCS